MNWTKEHPAEDGFYWFRDENPIPAIVFYERDGHMGETISYCGNEIGCGGAWSYPIEGEFWPVRIEPPQ